MIRFRFTNTLVVLILLTLPCAGCARDNCSFAPPSTSAGPVIPDGFGVNIDFTEARPGEMKMLAEAGFRWVRMDFVWNVTEPVKGQYDFTAYDRLMSALDQYSLHALFILDYTNPSYDSGAAPHTEEARQAFARWAVAAAKHFAGRGVIWETYNEPNIAQFWRPQPNVNDYAQLALVVARAFHEAAPAEKLVGPATSGIDFPFLEACFKAGLLDYWSAVSVHPYRRSDPEAAASDYCRLRELINTYAPLSTASGPEVQSPTSKVQRPNPPRATPGADRTLDFGRWTLDFSKKEIPILSSEWGYSSVWSGVDDEEQGQLLARSWLTNAANGVSLSIWYDWRDDGLDPKEPEHHFGTVYNSYHQSRVPVFDPKPAYLAAKTLTTFFGGYRFEKRQNVGSVDDYVLIFRKGGDLRVAAWTTAGRSHRIAIPLDPGQYSGSTHTGANIAVVTADRNGLAMTLTMAPVYLSRFGGR